MAADPAAARLIQIMKDKNTEPKDAIVAIRELLDRAGVAAQPAAAPNNGLVLWDEFIQIHRRRVSATEEETP
jgi:hypothetical protein